jgi:hypothetical protein
MLSRCRNPRHIEWHNYGGRGITVCERWLKFDNFRDDIGPRPGGMTLERDRVNEGYGPGNCRWATAKEQTMNRRHCTRYVYKDKILPLKDICEDLGLVYSTVARKKREGIPLVDLLGFAPETIEKS